MRINRCLFCGGDAVQPDHLLTCDGRQGAREAAADFDGQTYERARDHDRLQAQLHRVRAAMRDGRWHTLRAVALVCGDPEASISARLRDLRKPKFGGHIVERKYLHDGLWCYRLIVNVPEQVPA